jgi:hypothetical protein
MDASVVSMKEVAAVRNEIRVRRTDGALGPASTLSGAETAGTTVGHFLDHVLNAVFYFVLDASHASGNQAPGSMELFSCHR